VEQAGSVSDKRKGSGQKKAAGKRSGNSVQETLARFASKEGIADPVEQQLYYGRRPFVFGILALCVAVLGVWLSVSLLNKRQAESRPALATRSPVYTVLLMEVAADERGKALRLVNSTAVRSLAQQNEFFFQKSRWNNRLLLCVGKFGSKDSPRLRQLLARFHDFALGGKKLFASASIYQCQSDRAEDQQR